MSGFFSERYRDLRPYVPGEQPLDRSYIKLNTNESPFPPSPLAQMMARREAGDLQLYSDPDCRALCAVAAEKLGCGKDGIIFTNGSDEILFFAFAAFCGPDRPAVFPDITYGFYPVFAQLSRVPYRTVPLNGDLSVPVDSLCGCGGTVFLANPNAPTGIALPLRDVERIVASNPGTVVVVDEAYVDFGAESAAGLIERYPNLLVTQTFSKSRSLAGGRLGFGLACPELIADLQAVRFSMNPYNVNRMTMAAGIGALCDEAYFRECTEKIVAVRRSSAERLRALGFELTDSSANFLFVRHPSVGGEELCLRLREAGILVRHFDVPRIKDWNRITVGSGEQMDALIAALEVILS
jgi:histidinol-phosphate aminotransferase